MGGAPPPPVTREAASKPPCHLRDWDNLDAQELGTCCLPGVWPSTGPLRFPRREKVPFLTSNVKKQTWGDSAASPKSQY